MVHNDVAVAEVSMALFEALMEHAHDLVSINSEHGVMRYVSPSVRRILGYDPHDLIGRSSFDLLHPEDAARVIRSYERVASQVQRQRPVRFRYRHADGHYLLLEASSTNLLAHPSVGGIVVNARDVTEEVAQERRLRFKAGALSRISDAVVVSDESLRVKYLNQAAERHYGVRAADVLGHPLEQLYSYRYLGSTTDDQVRAVLLEHGEWHGTVVLTTRDGRTLYAEASMAVTFGDGDSVELFSVMRDVTDRVRTEEQLRLLESVVVNATDAVIITDADPLDVPGPRIRYVNEAFTRLTGYRPQDVLGFTPRLLQGPQTDQAALRRIGVALRTGRHVREELVNYTAAGEPFWVDLSIVPVRGEDGIVTHFIAIQHDVTARRLAVQLEQDRRRVLELLLRGAALELVLEEIVRAVERQQPGARGSVMLLREGRLFHGAAPNLPPAYVASVEGIVAEAQVGSCGAAVTFGVPITTADVRTDPRWAAFVDIALANGLYACRSTPIFSGAGEVIGTFAVYYDAPLAEGVPDTGLPSLAAQLAALAVDHHRMSERLRYQATHDALTVCPTAFSSVSGSKQRSRRRTRGLAARCSLLTWMGSSRSTIPSAIRLATSC
jgi:PAS domain S-box-containing protein